MHLRRDINKELIWVIIYPLFLRINFYPDWFQNIASERIKL